MPYNGIFYEERMAALFQKSAIFQTTTIIIQKIPTTTVHTKGEVWKTVMFVIIQSCSMDVIRGLGPLSPQDATIDCTPGELLVSEFPVTETEPSWGACSYFSDNYTVPADTAVVLIVQASKPFDDSAVH